MAALRTPGSLALAAAAALALILIVPGPARGCSCTDIPLSEYADSVVAAFSGSQIHRIDRTNDQGTYLGTILVLEVHEVYKGQAGPLIEVHTRSGGGDCGTDFHRMGVTGVAAFGNDGDGLSVHLCGSHVSISELEDVFGPGRPPDEKITLPDNTEEAATAAAAPPEEGGGIPGAAAALIIAAAVLIAVRRWALLRRRSRPDGE